MHEHVTCNSNIIMGSAQSKPTNTHHCNKINTHLKCMIHCYDADVMQAEEVAKKYDVKIYNDLEELLDKIEAVIIATPPHTHYEICSRCIYKNINVLVEKPMTVNLKSSNELLKKYDSLEVKPLFQVGFVERFNPVIDFLTEIVKEENIQNIFFVEKRLIQKLWIQMLYLI